jgi:glycolate oxidase iron-sulfur subunit
MCCGSAGSYNLTEPEMAERLRARKLRHLEATGAEAVVTANPGCILQLAAGLRARARTMAVVHIVELLDEAYRAAEGGA